MPRQILPKIENLSQQVQGILSRYQWMLDDDFLFADGAQIPQVATIFDRMANQALQFQGDDVSLSELLTLVAYRYDLDDIHVVGHGGYAIVIGNRDISQSPRVMRLVPEHHVRNIVVESDNAPDFEVRLDDEREPIRDATYPLILSDLFMMPRHTTKLIFQTADGKPVQAGGYPASLHCQLLPRVHPFNQPGLDQQLARQSGELLALALASLGVSVADAHGGNGGVLMDADGQPIFHTTRQSDGTLISQYIPVVIDYGYYSRIGTRTLAEMLIKSGVTHAQVQSCLLQHAPNTRVEDRQLSVDSLATIMDQSGLSPAIFGRLLYDILPARLNPLMWINHATHHWQTAKERTYPPLKTRSRLARLYPEFDEVVFPQRIEEYTFVI